ncbi:MAG: hypothetical protein CMH83_20350 [Nocardioides sp.]|nr:hypothetical protein [Nocardioides sp.]
MPRAHLPPPTFDVDHWSDAAARAALGTVVDSVATMIGFKVASLGLVQGDWLRIVSLVGDELLPAEAQVGHAFPLADVRADLDRAEGLGRFRFLADDGPAGDEVTGWVPVETALGAPGAGDALAVHKDRAWHPHDLLAAPLHATDGTWIGLISVDIPEDGLRPDRAQRQQLERYAELAERTLRVALDREGLSRRTRMAEATRHVVRLASSWDDLDRVFEQCRSWLLDGFAADVVTIRTYPWDDHDEGGTAPVEAPALVVDEIRDLARRGWQRQSVTVLHAELDDPASGPLPVDAQTANAEVMLRQGVTSMAVVPMGAGDTCLGHLVVARGPDGAPFTEDELLPLMDVGRDMGRSVANAHALIREHAAAARSAELATYKSDLLSTVSHELKNPLSVMSGHLELLEEESVGEDDPGLRRTVHALRRATTRMSRLVDDLLVLARASDTDNAESFEVLDAVAVATEALDLHALAAQRGGVDLRVEASQAWLPVRADPVALERAIGNLVGNAVKYTPSGGWVVIGAWPVGSDVVVEVRDTGVGISEADQAQLFTEFFRSTDPQVRRRPGTGLGLTITRRVAEQLGGRVEVESEIGRGSRFRLVLPRAT